MTKLILFQVIAIAALGFNKVWSDESVNSTTIESQTEPSSTTQESLRVESQESELMATTEMTTSTYKIPPTLLNTKIDYQDKSEKSLKNLEKTESAVFKPKTGQVIDARVKQAIIYSKQQAMKNFNGLNTKVSEPKKASQDQVAKSAEVNNDISNESPKQFLPSPEVSPLYNRANQLQDHFSPMNHYYRSTQQDARFPTETPFSSKPILDTRWLGANRSPNDHLKPTQPFEFMRPPSFPEGRNYHNSEFAFRNSHHRDFHNDDRITFPSDGPPTNDIRPNWPVEHQVPALNFKHPKGTWKWIPDDDESFTRNNTSYFVDSNSGLEAKTAKPVTPLLYESFPPQQQREHPYSFDQPKGFLSHLFGTHHQTAQAPVSDYQRYPTGPSGYPSSGSDTFLVTEEYSTTKSEEHSSPTKLPTIDIKHSRPSPWKKIIHVMAAAIPVGLIISALTPRIVYVHPNATVPTLQQPLLPPNQQFPNQQFPNQQPISGQINGPFPPRQRSSEITDESMNSSLIHFLKTMELQFQEKQLQSGEKLDGSCEDRFFCEVALIGKQPTADALHQTLYHVALETSDSEARKSGLGEIFAAIKRQSCDVFECEKLF